MFADSEAEGGGEGEEAEGLEVLVELVGAGEGDLR